MTATYLPWPPSFIPTTDKKLSCRCYVCSAQTNAAYCITHARKPVFLGPLRKCYLLLVNRACAPDATTYEYLLRRMLGYLYELQSRLCTVYTSHVRLHLDCPCLLARPFPSPLPARGPSSCIGDAATGLGHCHDNGVVVCDLKPANVILVYNGGRYTAKLADFGLACGECAETRAFTTMTPMRRSGYHTPHAVLLTVRRCCVIGDSG